MRRRQTTVDYGLGAASEPQPQQALAWCWPNAGVTYATSTTGIRERLQAKRLVGRQDIELECAIGDHVTCYSFSKGERIRFTRNDYQRGFTNGALGTVLEVEQLNNGDTRFVVRTDDQRLVRFLASQYCNDQGKSI